MSLRNILLGMLSQPASGYDLKQSFGESLGHFWDAELSQIYPTLKRLEDDGLLRSKREPSEKGPERKVYRRTAAGTRGLKAWLAAGAERSGERLTWLAQVWFLGQQGDLGVALSFFERLRDSFAADLAGLRAIEERMREEEPGYPDALPDEMFFPHLTLDLGLHKLAAKVAWCERCVVRIEARMAAATASA
jgi:PadR family transcriptional regulator, phenolic acid-responsive transcriptional regulator